MFVLRMRSHTGPGNRQLRDRFGGPFNVAAALIFTLAATLVVTASPAAAVDCSTWNEPTGDQRIETMIGTITGGEDSTWNIRRGPSTQASCDKGVDSFAGDTVEVYAFADGTGGDLNGWYYIYNLTEDEWGWTLDVSVSLAPSEGGPRTYDTNLAMIRSQGVRNRHQDDSSNRSTPQDQLDISDDSDHLGPRSDYLGNPNGNPANSFPTINEGNFRIHCEFSHFAYDDPLIAPNQPGAAHLHMFFGNTDVNAYSTYDTLANSGSSTCNGQELNRTGYWVPAMIDGDGNARIPERIVVYYKGYGRGNGGRYPEAGSLPYQPGMANISPHPITVPEISNDEGGHFGQVNYKCANNFSSSDFASGVNEIPTCSGSHFGAERYPNVRAVLEMDIKFWNCFPPGGDITDYRLWKPSSTSNWFNNECDGDIYPNLEYFVSYVIEPDEDTSDWYLASDVDADSVTSIPTRRGPNGATHHADWWGGWHPDINQEWIDNCVNDYKPGIPTGCGVGYLSDGGTDNQNPVEGRALLFSDQYDTPGQSSSYKVPIATIFDEICAPLNPGRELTTPEAGAWCKPATPIRVGLGAYPASGGFAEEVGASNPFPALGWEQVPWASYNSTNGETRPAICDLDMAGSNDTVVGLGPGANGWIAILRDGTTWEWQQIPWAAYNSANGESNVACGDIDGDGLDEIVVGLGTGGGGWAYIFDDAAAGYGPVDAGWLNTGYTSYNTANGAVHPAVGNLDDDDADELILATGAGGNRWARMFAYTGAGIEPFGGATGDGWIQAQDTGSIDIADHAVWPTICDGQIVFGASSATGNGGEGWLNLKLPSGDPAPRSWLQVPWGGYNTASGATSPACGNIDGDTNDEILVGLSGPTAAGYFAIFDDVTTSDGTFLDWARVHWSDYNSTVGTTRPAVG